MNQGEVLVGAAGDFATAGQAEFVGDQVGPAGTVDKIGAALAGGADGEVFWPVSAIGLGRAGDQHGAGQRAGNQASLEGHGVSPLHSGCGMPIPYRIGLGYAPNL